ncbi:TetR family transcriptional regulator [Phaeovibrio sulfidiphilus]|uniref:TetR family transcriptional regulator n=1 Tax=Phaeovibrio sulfidiphilus TaxID=1220600 RepID=A0A8J6YMG3_9PROT|nr:TetR/AcrR family transcriptional regulator [Phaeovibrio sulfidiphilus]MBE1237145.1 TetR family transcriptional regulator [Phaeovibrio sulfidiphilus]
MGLPRYSTQVYALTDTVGAVPAEPGPVGDADSNRSSPAASPFFGRDVNDRSFLSPGPPSGATGAREPHAASKCSAPPAASYCSAPPAAPGANVAPAASGASASPASPPPATEGLRLSYGRSARAASIRLHALRLFAQKGYAAVPMRDIADAVGIRVGGLYNHYPTKQALLHDLMVTHMQTVLGAWRAVDPLDAPPQVRFQAFVRFHVRFHFERPEAVFIAYMELRSLEPDNFREVELLRRSYEQVLQAILHAGADVFRVQDVAVASRALIAMLTGVTTWYRPDGRLGIAEIEDIYLDMASRAVGLEPGSLRAPRGPDAC